MKKLAVFVLTLLVLIPCFAKEKKFGVGTTLSAGTELYTGTYGVIPQLTFGADAQLPFYKLDQESSVSLPLSFSYITDYLNNGRYTNLSSFRTGIGVRYIYQFKPQWQVGFGAYGGFWFFNINKYVKPTTVYHSLEGRVGYSLGKHFVLSVPVVITTSSFGTNYNVSVGLTVK